MPWQNIIQILGSSPNGPLEGLTRAMRSALGLGKTKATDRAAFTAAVVALSAKLSKSDGVALRIEEETFERLFHFDPEEIGNVRWLFALAAQDVAGFEAYARAVARALDDRPDLKQDVFEALLHIASADGIMHEGEDRYLETVSNIFGYTPAQHRALRSRFVEDDGDPYAILGVAHATGNDALKAHYRDLVRRNHPDALAGKGLSRELQDIAQRKLAAINAAWDAITRERGL
jgi:DnaJ like chaperone protein